MEENHFKIHICTEEPCPLRDKECADILNNGFETHYTNDLEIEKKK